MESTSPQIEARSPDCEEILTEEAEKKFMDVCTTMESTLSGNSPTKSVQKSPIGGEKSVSPLTPAGVPVGDLVKLSPEQNGHHDKSNSAGDAKMSENGTERPASSEDLRPTDSSERSVEGVQTVGPAEGTQSDEKPEETGSQSEASVEAEQTEGKQVEQKDDDGQESTGCGEDALAAGSDGAGDRNGSSGKAAAEDVKHKIELIKLEGSPQVKSPTKTSCAAI